MFISLVLTVLPRSMPKRRETRRRPKSRSFRSERMETRKERRETRLPSLAMRIWPLLGKRLRRKQLTWLLRGTISCKRIWPRSWPMSNLCDLGGKQVGKGQLRTTRSNGSRTYPSRGDRMSFEAFLESLLMALTKLGCLCSMIKLCA